MSTRIARMVRFGLVYGAAVLCRAGSVGAQSYTITDLGTLGGNASQAYAVNELGQVVGEATTVGGNSHAFLWLPEPGYGLPAGMNDLGTLGGSGSAAFGINNLGFVVGQADTSDPAISRAFQWDPTTGVMTDLGTPAGPSVARAINDWGEIVGTARDAQGFDQAFHRSQGGAIVFFSDVSPGDATSVGVALGYSGNVNFSGTYFFPARAFKFGGETGLLPLDDLGVESFANDMNGLNQAVGSVTSNTFEHAALWIFTALTDLGTLGGTDSRAQGINDSTHIVGVADTGAETEHAFLWHDGAMTDLNDLLPPSSGWELATATDINHSGKIVGHGAIGAETHAFLLEAGPGVIPTVSDWGIVVMGLLVLTGGTLILVQHRLRAT